VTFIYKKDAHTPRNILVELELQEARRSRGKTSSRARAAP
jgi:hypothetical protein